MSIRKIYRIPVQSLNVFALGFAYFSHLGVERSLERSFFSVAAVPIAEVHRHLSDAVEGYIPDTGMRVSQPR